RSDELKAPFGDAGLQVSRGYRIEQTRLFGGRASAGGRRFELGLGPLQAILKLLRPVLDVRTLQSSLQLGKLLGSGELFSDHPDRQLLARARIAEQRKTGFARQKLR